MTEQKTLFDEPPVPAVDKPEPVWIDLFQLHAQDKLGVGPEWEAFMYETLEDDQHVKITLGIPTLRKSGPRKGQRKWNRKEGKVAIFSRRDHKAWCEEWSMRTGRCARCTGSGKLFKSISEKEGTKYNPCPDCSGSGKRGGTSG